MQYALGLVEVNVTLVVEQAELELLGEGVERVALGDGTTWSRCNHLPEDLADLLLDGHPAQQVLNALRG